MPCNKFPERMSIKRKGYLGNAISLQKYVLQNHCVSMTISFLLKITVANCLWFLLLNKTVQAFEIRHYKNSVLSLELEIFKKTKTMTKIDICHAIFLTFWIYNSHTNVQLWFQFNLAPTIKVWCIAKNFKEDCEWVNY